jgi:hypothetical protein
MRRQKATGLGRKNALGLFPELGQQGVIKMAVQSV